MFSPSTTPIASAITEITDTVGASGDTDMGTRALRSLAAGVKYLNGRYNWSWLLTEASPISVVAPFSVAITAGASGAASATAGAGHGVKVDDIIAGSGFALGTRVSATAASAIGFNFAVTGITASLSTTVTATRDFYDMPPDWKQPYTVRLLATRATLAPAQRRGYDRTTPDEFAAATPQWYDLFAGYQKGKIRLLPPPAAADTLLLRYYRRMSVPTASADATVLDIPQDYDFHLLAWSKWHFLTDKGDGRQAQAQTWISLAQEGVKVMLMDQTRQPDEEIGFSRQPFWNSSSITNTRSIDWTYT